MVKEENAILPAQELRALPPEQTFRQIAGGSE